MPTQGPFKKRRQMAGRCAASVQPLAPAPQAAGRAHGTQPGDESHPSPHYFCVASCEPQTSSLLLQTLTSISLFISVVVYPAFPSNAATGECIPDRLQEPGCLFAGLSCLSSYMGRWESYDPVYISQCCRIPETLMSEKNSDAPSGRRGILHKAEW